MQIYTKLDYYNYTDYSYTKYSVDCIFDQTLYDFFIFT